MYLTRHHSTTTHVTALLKAEITQKNLFYLHLEKEVCASNSSVILQSLHTLLQCHMYIRDHFIINGTIFINFNTDKFKACAVFLKQ